MSMFRDDLDYSETANIGDTIRALDFAPRPDVADSYIEGVVVDKGMIMWESPNGRVRPIFEGFTIRLTKQVHAGREVDFPEGCESYVPFTSSSMLDWEGRVTKVAA